MALQLFSFCNFDILILIVVNKLYEFEYSASTVQMCLTMLAELSAILALSHAKPKFLIIPDNFFYCPLHG